MSELAVIEQQVEKLLGATSTPSTSPTLSPQISPEVCDYANLETGKYYLGDHLIQCNDRELCKIFNENGARFDSRGELLIGPGRIDRNVLRNNFLSYNKNRLLLLNVQESGVKVSEFADTRKDLFTIHLRVCSSRYMYLIGYGILTDGVIGFFPSHDLPGWLNFYVAIDEVLSYLRDGGTIMRYNVESLSDVTICDPTNRWVGEPSPLSKHPGLYMFAGDIMRRMSHRYIGSVYDKKIIGIVKRGLGDTMPRVFTDMVGRYLLRTFPPMAGRTG